jgi:hypothetical protein
MSTRDHLLVERFSLSVSAARTSLFCTALFFFIIIIIMRLAFFVGCFHGLVPIPV